MESGALHGGLFQCKIDESMDCEQAETKPEEKSAEAESVENSDIELSNNSPNGSTTVFTVENLRKRFLDKIDGRCMKPRCQQP